MTGFFGARGFLPPPAAAGLPVPLAGRDPTLCEAGFDGDASVDEDVSSILMGLPSKGTPLYCLSAFAAATLVSKTTSAVP